MANHRNALKAARKAAARALRNKMWRSMVKTAIRKVREAIAAGNVAEAQVLLSKAFKVIDKAASKGVLHANTAARKKARLAKKLAALAKSA
ncbi:MAG: 30S ribosomal protein S20 [Firmicutes bacterium]|nr:30S ribosomal protein S20 [Bacillota bacterium]